MTPQLDGLISELAAIQERLLEEPPLEERAILRNRQEELRATSHELRKAVHDELSLTQARAQLAHLEEQRQALVAAHVPHAASPAFSAGVGMARWNLREPLSPAHHALQLDEVELEIHHLRGHIVSMEAD